MCDSGCSGAAPADRAPGAHGMDWGPLHTTQEQRGAPLGGPILYAVPPTCSQPPPTPRPAGIPWLVSRYKQYILLRDRLFTDTGTLRSRLDIAMPGAGRGPCVGGCQAAGRRREAALLGPARTPRGPVLACVGCWLG